MRLGLQLQLRRRLTTAVLGLSLEPGQTRGCMTSLSSRASRLHLNAPTEYANFNLDDPAQAFST